MTKIKYIGLDISTSIIGICFLDNNYNLVDLQNINLKKIKCIFEKSIYTKNILEELYNRYNFEEEVKISIEEAFQSFSKGFSSAKTLSQLSRFNGIVSYLVYDIFNVKPLYLNVNSARKSLSIKITKDKTKNTKEQVFEWVRKEIEFIWPEKTLKSGPNKGLVKFDESCYDMSDAYVICKALKYYESNIRK
tara:strand:- start:5759 stop:6331 length:573 start_codon:yes stop_codon:yes gene_type:complete